MRWRAGLWGNGEEAYRQLCHTIPLVFGGCGSEAHGPGESSGLFVISYLLSRYMRPEGPWQRLRRCLSSDGVVFLNTRFPRPQTVASQSRASCAPVSQAVGQLLCYLECIRASWIKMGKNKLPLYGVASDGREYKFVVLKPGGRVRVSDMLSIDRHFEIIRTADRIWDGTLIRDNTVSVTFFFSECKPS